jgi:hypothetical protein
VEERGETAEAVEGYGEGQGKEEFVMIVHVSCARRPWPWTERVTARFDVSTAWALTDTTKQLRSRFESW